MVPGIPSYRQTVRLYLLERGSRPGRYTCQMERDTTTVQAVLSTDREVAGQRVRPGDRHELRPPPGHHLDSAAVIQGPRIYTTCVT